VPTIRSEIRSGAYYDSVILMQLQRSLAQLPGILDAGVVMGTPANKDLLGQSDLLTEEIGRAAADDLVIVVRAEDLSVADAALARVDELLTQRRSQTVSAYRPKSLETAAGMRSDANWVLISVPGRYAAGVARQALSLGKHVFLYSDNVSVEDEISLKQEAAGRGLLVMGPDCGTAIVNGVGLGFANRVRRGSIGVVGASGTGLQLVTARIHQLGGGITHALGTGGRDLSEQVGAITALQSLDLLAQDAETAVIVLISKPPAPSVAEKVLTAARSSGKPVVVNFIGYEPTTTIDGIYFARTLDETAELAVKLRDWGPGTGDWESGEVTSSSPTAAVGHHPIIPSQAHAFAPRQKYLRGIFSGGTLAYEALLLLREFLPTVYSNAPLKGGPKLANAHRSQGHTIVDLGEDEFTVGRLHPMLDNDLRIRRLTEEAADPEIAVILLDVVLGDGAHPDPASELVPAIERAQASAQADGRPLAVIAVVVGTDEDPQEMASQIEQLRGAGVHVFTRNDEAVRAAGRLLGTAGDERRKTKDERRPNPQSPVPNLQSPISSPQSPIPFSAINVGLESFAASLINQGAPVIHVDWRPPAGGNERLMGILARMRKG
jgi:FdrA protein